MEVRRGGGKEKDSNGTEPEAGRCSLKGCAIYERVYINVYGGLRSGLECNAVCRYSVQTHSCFHPIIILELAMTLSL